MRIDFISGWPCSSIAGFLLIATQVWAMGTVEWLFIVGGIVMIALAAGALGQDAGPQRNARRRVLAVLGVWSIVQAIVFDRHDPRVGLVRHGRRGRAARHRRSRDPRD